MLVEVARTSEIASGGMKFVKAGDLELCICNCSGQYYAVSRRCGHMNSALEMGALDGTILTCAMHHVQFDVTTGEALNSPVPEFIEEQLQPMWAKKMQYIAMLMQHINVCDVRIFPVKVEGTVISVETGQD